MLSTTVRTFLLQNFAQVGQKKRDKHGQQFIYVQKWRMTVNEPILINLNITKHIFLNFFTVFVLFVYLTLVSNRSIGTKYGNISRTPFRKVGFLYIDFHVTQTRPVALRGISCTEFNPHRSRKTESAQINRFTPFSKVWLSVRPFTWNPCCPTTFGTTPTSTFKKTARTI